MAGWNLPPGCRVSDIPGNDTASEVLCDLCGYCFTEYACEEDTNNCPYGVERIGTAVLSKEMLLSEACDQIEALSKERKLRLEGKYVAATEELKNRRPLWDKRSK